MFLMEKKKSQSYSNPTISGVVAVTDILLIMYRTYM